MWKLKSPQKKLQICIQQDEQERLYYSVDRDGEPVLIKSALGFESSLGSFTDGFTFLSQKESSVSERYSIPAGKKSLYVNEANELELQFTCKAHSLVLRLRAYDDGAAFRYELPETSDDLFRMEREITDFRYAGEHNELWLQTLTPSYEATYDHSGWEDTEGRDYGMPSLTHNETSGVWSMITEANVYNTNGSYCSCHLRGAGGRGFSLAFAPEENGNPLSCRLPFLSPWRVVAAASSLSELVNTTINYNLNPASDMENTSWIKPGRCLWAWWEFENGAELFTEQKRYVDFAAAIGFEGLTVDADWDMTWLAQLCDYAHSKNLVVWLWSAMQYIDTPEKAQAKIPLWAGCGVDGLKVDFFQNDSQHTMWQYEMIANLMTEHKLMINFHGATKCMGEGRTWPNFMTAEGILGLEHYKWSGLPNAKHNCTVPFTRNVIGPMDYTPTGFSNKNRNTTLGHQLALPIVFESGAAHIAASIYYLEAWKGLQLLRRMKPVYEGLRVLSGFPGHHAAIMRWTKGEWFIGCITDRAMTLRLPMDFLPEGEFEAEIYEDDSSGEMLGVQCRKICRDTVLELPLLQSGGAGVYITEKIAPPPQGITGGYMSGERSIHPADTFTLYGGSEPMEYENGTAAVLLNGSVRVNVQAPRAARYTVRCFYAALGPVPVQVQCGANNWEATLPQSGSNKIFIASDITVDLPEGESVLTFKRLSGPVPAFEKLHIIDNSPPIERYIGASEGILSGGAELVTDDKGRKKAVGLGLGGSLVFRDVFAAREGFHIIRFAYSAGESRDLTVEINGEPACVTNLHNTSGWGFPGWDVCEGTEIRVQLKQGANCVKLFHDSGRCAHIYGITVLADE